MTVLEFLIDRKIVTPPCKDLEIGFTDGTKESLTELISSYSKIAIEKKLIELEKIQKEMMILSKNNN